MVDLRKFFISLLFFLIIPIISNANELWLSGSIRPAKDNISPFDYQWATGVNLYKQKLDFEIERQNNKVYHNQDHRLLLPIYNITIESRYSDAQDKDFFSVMIKGTQKFTSYIDIGIAWETFERDYENSQVCLTGSIKLKRHWIDSKVNTYFSTNTRHIDTIVNFEKFRLGKYFSLSPLAKWEYAKYDNQRKEDYQGKMIFSYDW